MRTARIAQNFKGRKAVIFSAAGSSLEVLETVLRRLGLDPEIRPIAAGQALALPADLSPERHVALIDGDLILPAAWPGGEAAAEGAAEGTAAPAPCPTIGLVGSEAPSRLRALMQLGALAFLSKPVHGGSVYSALYLAVNEFNRTSQLHAGLGEMIARRHKRMHVIRAVVALMRASGADENAAYDLLRKEAMRARVSVEDHCEILMRTLTTGDLDRTTTNKRCEAR